MSVLYSKLTAFSIHFLVSFCISALVAVLIFFVWYPGQYGQIASGYQLWLILVAVEVSLGPTVSIVIYHPRKKVRELVFDYGVVSFFQVGALLYGLYTVFLARPVGLIYVKDRFELVTISDFSNNSIDYSVLDRSIFDGPKLYGVNYPEDIKLKSSILLDAVFGGRDYHLRPEFFYELTPDIVINSLNRFDELCRSSGFSSNLCAGNLDGLMWAPLSNNGVFGLVVINTSPLEVAAYFSLDPWQFSD